MYIMLQVQQPCLQQELFSYGARRLLLQVVPSPPTSTNFTDPPPFDNSSFDMNSHFSPSMAIILVVLLSAFFFMGFFSVYVRRCTTDDDQNDMRRDIHNHMSNRVTEQQGLDPAMVANLPMVAYSASIKKKGCNECVVCLTEFEEDEPLKLLPKCKHAFHTDCIDMWLFSHTTCPLCRRSLVGGGSTRSFRWGSSRRTSFNYNEGSSRGGRQQQQTAEVTPPEIQLTVTDDAAAPRPPLPPSGKRRALRRSNSTGHSLLRRAWSRTALPFSSTPLASALVTASPGGATVIPAAMHRSRSVSAMSGGRNHEEVDLAAVEGVRPRLTRGWSVSQLRRALSLRSSQLQDATAFSTPVGQAAASSSTRRTFERLGA